MKPFIMSGCVVKWLAHLCGMMKIGGLISAEYSQFNPVVKM